MFVLWRTNSVKPFFQPPENPREYRYAAILQVDFVRRKTRRVIDLNSQVQIMRKLLSITPSSSLHKLHIEPT